MMLERTRGVRGPLAKAAPRLFRCLYPRAGGRARQRGCLLDASTNARETRPPCELGFGLGLPSGSCLRSFGLPVVRHRAIRRPDLARRDRRKSVLDPEAALAV